jgi:hypothetical protein
LEDQSKPLTTKLGNLSEVIAAMLEVEKPDPKKKFPPPNEAVVYPAISDLYHATLDLLSRYFKAFELTPAALDPHFTPNHNQISYGAFDTRYKFNKIKTREDVKEVANAVADQGEGRTVASTAKEFSETFQFGDDGEVLPKYQSSPGSRFFIYDKFTHFKRFEEIQDKLQAQDWNERIGGDVFYKGDGKKSPDLPEWAPDFETLQSALNTLWSYIVDLLEDGLRKGTLSTVNNNPKVPGFNDVMISFKYLIPMIWQWGHVPSFIYRAGVTTEQAQAALDKVDPWSLFHWDEKTAEIRAKYPDKKNSCQGLNECAGLGWGGIATEKGNGACATADLHTCQGSNSCSLQGGCGFLSTVNGKSLPPSEQWIPGENQGNQTGGCQTPIATTQVFDRNAEIPTSWPPDAQKRLEGLRGTKVWDEARQLFAQREKIDKLPTPTSKQEGDINYDGTKRRSNVVPTSR